MCIVPMYVYACICIDYLYIYAYIYVCVCIYVCVYIYVSNLQLCCFQVGDEMGTEKRWLLCTVNPFIFSGFYTICIYYFKTHKMSSLL